MFLAKSDYLKKIKNIADMAKELKLNVYIWGEKGVGKTFLANYIASNEAIIVENFDENLITSSNRILIATGKKALSKEILKNYFDIDIELKPLSQREEDINYFIKFFIKEAKENLKIDKSIKITSPDISENLNSLKRQIYKNLLAPSQKEEILKMLKDFYLTTHLTYEEELNDFEKTLFEAMKIKYRSKLKISEKLKINRVTLTKKMKALNV